MKQICIWDNNKISMALEDIKEKEHNIAQKFLYYEENRDRLEHLMLEREIAFYNDGKHVYMLFKLESGKVIELVKKGLTEDVR